MGFSLFEIGATFTFPCPDWPAAARQFCFAPH
jgi:hypothetical protein